MSRSRLDATGNRKVAHKQQQGSGLRMELEFLEHSDACWYHRVKQEQFEIGAEIIKPSYSFYQVSFAVDFILYFFVFAFGKGTNQVVIS